MKLLRRTRNHEQLVLQTFRARAKLRPGGRWTFVEIAKLLDIKPDTLRAWMNTNPQQSMPLTYAHELANLLDLGSVEILRPWKTPTGIKHQLAVRALAEERDRMGVRTTDLARALDITPATLRRWETSHDDGPSLAELELWATLLYHPGITLTNPWNPAIGGIFALVPSVDYYDDLMMGATVDSLLGFDASWFMPRTHDWLDLQQQGMDRGLTTDSFRINYKNINFDFGRPNATREQTVADVARLARLMARPEVFQRMFALAIARGGAYEDARSVVRDVFTRLITSDKP